MGRGKKAFKLHFQKQFGRFSAIKQQDSNKERGESFYEKRVNALATSKEIAEVVLLSTEDLTQHWD